ncbi:siphovirus ReqiPepy6 Gp37-like family protein [Brevibacterium sp.]|uniref:siphovirus ReqiPepy6 Gp37-like family protein n=1 Tax=Brevibacterium sp. TaxID=1701 RepID=UPI00281199FB|nr:siphovirus ReqiPepy6 Gp37-like family protein [Brevibacterium sp.]
MFTPDFVSRGTLPVVSGTIVLRRNDVSTFALDVIGEDNKWRRLKHGYRIVIIDDDLGEGVQLLSGWATGMVDKRDTGVQTIKVSGVSDVQWLKQRLTLPDPAAALDAQSSAAYWKATGPAETVIRSLVNVNAGPGALASRRAPLIIDPDQGRGPQVSVNTRFKTVIEEAQALAGSALTFDIAQDIALRMSVLRFSVGRDLRRAVVLTEDNGGLPDRELTNSAPEATHVLVAGQGEGTARTLKLVQGNTSDWGVYAEVFQDRRDTDAAAELIQAGQETLTEAQEKASVSLSVTDTPRLRFGHRYGLGDTITVQLETGGQVADIVQQAELTYSETGRTVKLQIGPVPDDKDAPRWVREVRRLQRRVTGLEAR